MHKIAIVANNKPETQDVYEKLHQAIIASDALQIDDDQPDVAISIGVDGKEFKHNSPIKEIRYEVAPKEANFVTFKGPAFWERVDKSFIGTENND